MKTTCCSDKCEKRHYCAKYYFNNMGECVCEDYSSFASGSISNGECKVEYWCGKEGDYKMFEPTIIIDDIVDVAKEEMIYITKKEYDELLEYKYMYENLCD